MIALLLLWACGGGETGPAPTVDGWAVARAELTGNPRSCLHQHPAYCVTDPDFVDPILQEILDRGFEGVMPDTQRAAERVAAQAVGPYRSRQTATPEGRARVEERIRRWYADPTAQVRGDVVTVDLGLPPGPLARVGRGGWQVASSDVVVGGEWATPEAVRTLRRLADRHRNAARIEVSLDVPVGGGHEAFVYTYDRRADRILVERGTRANEVWYAEPVGDWSAWAGGRSLHTRDLKHCSLQLAAEQGQRCPS